MVERSELASSFVGAPGVFHVMDSCISTFESSPTRRARRAEEEELEGIVLAKSELYQRRVVVKSLLKEMNASRAALRALVAEEARTGSADASSIRSVSSARGVEPLAVRIASQRERVRRDGLLLTKAEDEANAADMALHKLEGMGQHRTKVLEKSSAERKATMAAATRYRHSRAQSETQRKADAMGSSVRRERSAAATSTVRRTRADAVGVRQARDAAARLAPALRQIDAAKEKELAYRSEVQTQRAMAAIKLKKSIDIAAAEAKGQSTRAVENAATRAAEIERERERLVAQGLNPYRVFREKEEKARVEAQRTRLVRAQEQTRLKIARRMVAEGKQIEAAHALEKEHEEHVEAYNRNLGRGAREARVTRYLREKTRAHTDMLDPTGHAHRIDPSEVTTIKDYTFGMGQMAKTRPDILEMVRSRKANAGVSFDPRWVPKIQASDVVEDADAVRALGSTMGDGDGVTAEELAAGFGQSDQQRQPGSELVGALGGAPAGAGSSAKAKGAAASSSGMGTAAAAAAKGEDGAKLFGPFGQQHSTGQLSVYTQKMHAQAREKQRRNIERVDPDDPLAFAQSVCGRTFSGVAFVPVRRRCACLPRLRASSLALTPPPDRTQCMQEPPEIVFADFTPDVPQRRTITLTNVSLSFNQFKVLALPPDLRDRFEVEYVKPPPMAAGKTCKVHITFTPRSQASFDAALPLLAQTGPFSIPLRVRAKCCKPTLSANRLSLEDMLVGEMKSHTLTVHNAGALGSAFEVIPLRATYAGTDDVVSEDHMAQFTIAPITGELPPRSAAGEPGEAHIAVRFAPEVDIAITVPLLIRFTVSHGRNGARGARGGGDSPSSPTRRGPGSTSLASEGGGGGGSSAWLGSESGENGGEGRRRRDESLSPMRRSGGGAAGGDERSESMSHSPSVAGRWKERKPEVIEFTVPVHCSAEKLPVKVRDDVLDLHCCVAGKLYRTKAVLQNLGKNSFECRVVPPSDLVETAPNVLSFNPELGFVQPPTEDPVTGLRKPGSLEIAIKFRPTKNLVSLCRRWADIDQPHDVVKIPITVKVRGQPLPVKFTICAQITTAAVTALPAALDFGVCPVVQETRATLVLRNKSSLAQRVGFIKLCAGVRIEPSGGFLTLLPHSRVQCTVIYAPRGEGNFSFPLQVQCGLGSVISIACRGEATLAPLHFSSTVINLAPAVGGEIQSQSIFVSNPIAPLGDADGDGVDDGAPRVFEFCIPDPARSHLSVTPSVATIPPGETLRVVVSFAPPEDTFAPESANAAGGAEAPAADEEGVAAAKSAERSVSLASSSPSAPTRDGAAKAANALLGAIDESCEGEQWSRHGHWLVPCYVKPIDAEDAKCATLRQPVFLRVNTVQTRCEVGVNVRLIDFGQVSVGQSESRWLTVKNMLSHGDAKDLDFLPLAPAGAFAVLNAPRPLPPGESHKLLVRFSPLTSEKVNETLIVCSGPAQIRVRLKGCGISATLGIELPPFDAAEESVIEDVGGSDNVEGVIDVGHTLAGVATTRTFQLHNRSDVGEGRLLRYMVEQDRRSEALMSAVRALAHRCALRAAPPRSPFVLTSRPHACTHISPPSCPPPGIMLRRPPTSARDLVRASRGHHPPSADVGGERALRAAARAGRAPLLLDVPRPHADGRGGWGASRADARLELAAPALRDLRRSGLARRSVRRPDNNDLGAPLHRRRRRSDRAQQRRPLRAPRL
jgi:hypothetical protein